MRSEELKSGAVYEKQEMEIGGRSMKSRELGAVYEKKGMKPEGGL